MRQGRKDTWATRHSRALFGLIKPLMVSGTQSFCSSGKANVTCAKPDVDDVRRMILLQGGATNRILLKTTAVFKITWLDGWIRFLGTSTLLALEKCVLSQFPCWWFSSKQFLKAYIGKHRGYSPPLATNAFISKSIHRNNDYDENKNPKPLSWAFLLHSSPDLPFHSPASLPMHTIKKYIYVFIKRDFKDEMPMDKSALVRSGTMYEPHWSNNSISMWCY